MAERVDEAPRPGEAPNLHGLVEVRGGQVPVECRRAGHG